MPIPDGFFVSGAFESALLIEPGHSGIDDPMMTPAEFPCLSVRGDGVMLQLSVVPNARRTQVDGLHDGALRVRLAAPPIEGRANETLVAWLAKALGVPRRDVELVRGEASRRKAVAIAASRDVVAAWLAVVLPSVDQADA